MAHSQGADRSPARGMRGVGTRGGVVCMSDRDEPLDPENPQEPENPEEPESTRSASAFLPIGITFLAVGIAFLANEDTRPTAWAFLPLGFTFFFLGMNANGRRRESGPDGAPDHDAAPDPDEPGSGSADDSERP